MFAKPFEVDEPKCYRIYFENESGKVLGWQPSVLRHQRRLAIKLQKSPFSEHETRLNSEQRKVLQEAWRLMQREVRVPNCVALCVVERQIKRVGVSDYEVVDSFARRFLIDELERDWVS